MVNTIVSYFRFFVEVAPYSMTTQVAHHTVVVLLGMLLDGTANLVDTMPGLGGFHTNLQALLGDAHQLFLLRSCLTYYKHTRGIGIVAVENRGEVHIDDIALLQDMMLVHTLMGNGGVSPSSMS